MQLSHLTRKQKSLRSEKALAKQLGGKRQPASGALPVKSLRGDVKTRHWLIDDKVTDVKSYSLKHYDWVKIRRQAFCDGRKPCIRINFTLGSKLFVIGEQEFLILHKTLCEDAARLIFI